MKTRSFWRKNFHELEFLKSQKLQPLDNKAYKCLLKIWNCGRVNPIFGRKQVTNYHLALLHRIACSLVVCFQFCSNDCFESSFQQFSSVNFAQMRNKHYLYRSLQSYYLENAKPSPPYHLGGQGGEGDCEA